MEIPTKKTSHTPIKANASDIFTEISNVVADI